MTSVVDIIYEGFRESSLISEVGHPTPSQFNQGLYFIQNLVSDVTEYEAGEPLVDYYDCNWFNSGGDWEGLPYPYPQGNVRIVKNSDTPWAIYLPVNPAHGSRVKVLDPENLLNDSPLILDANGGNIEGAVSVVVNTNGINRAWRYSRETANWSRIEDLDETSEMPYEARFDDFFIISLAARLSPRYRKELPAETREMLRKARSHLRSYYKQGREMASELGFINGGIYGWGFG